MAEVIHPQFGTAGPARCSLPPAALPNRAAHRLLGTIVDAIRRGLAVRELRRLDDRLLRDIGLDRGDISGGAGPSRTTVAWDPATGSHLIAVPGP